MKRMIDDGMLDTAAKSFIKHYEGANAPTDAPSSENSYFTSIKVAKAKAGARARINRTIRICAVAAVLMIGLVCALFMGADEVELPPAPDPINLDKTFDAYMWTNNSTDPSENMPVKVRMIVEETYVDRLGNNQSYEEYDHSLGKYGTVTGREYNITMIVSDLNGNEVALYADERFRKVDATDENAHSSDLPANYVPYISYNTELPIELKHTETPLKHYDEEIGKWVHEQETPIKRILLEFNEDFTDFEVFISYKTEHPELEEGLESLFVKDNTVAGKKADSYVWSHEDAIFITCGAATREEAIERRYEIAEARIDAIVERTGITSGFLFDRVKNRVWK